METRTISPGGVGGSARAPASKSVLQRAIACATLAQGVSHIRGEPLCADALAALGIARDLGAKVRAIEGGIEIEGSPLFGAARLQNRVPLAGEVTQRQKAPHVEDVALAESTPYAENVGLKENPASSREEADSAVHIRARVSSTSRAPLILSCGESGLCMRMFSPIAALLDRPVVLVGSGSLARRPMHMVETALESLGVSCASDRGLQPLHIQGPFLNRYARIDAQGSSQLLTGLLIAMPLLGGSSTLEVENLVSSGYLDLSIEVCARFGVEILRHGIRTFSIKGGQHYRATSFEVEGDWSGAAFLAVAAAIRGAPGGLRIEGLDARSSQPDKAIVEVLRAAGAEVRQSESALEIAQPAQGVLTPFEFDATDCPDIFPPLAAFAGAIAGVSSIRGVHRLLSKESNRASALVSMLENLGAHAEIRDDTMRIHGGTLKGGRIDSHGDHRIAMAAAIAALASESEVSINGAECVSKSWPGFFEVLDSIRVD